ncbi:MAG: citramalate synthase [Planctomycetaceae bacterium]|nr:MAG: citramalate synthase [Planctomycetaceae bacterium]
MRTIEIYDTTLRDGSQGEGVNFSLEDKIAITSRLDAAGMDYIEGGYPLSNPKDAQYFTRVRSLTLKHAKIVAFGMTRRRGMRAADDPGMQAMLDAGTSVITIVGKTSTFHVTEVLGVSCAENLAMISDTIAYLTAAQREVFYDAEHFFDGWKLDRDYARETILAAARAGATRIILCDTNGGTLPDEVAAVVKQAVTVLQLASLDVPIGIHCHNDCDVAVANSLAAVAAGAAQIQGTINGIGERCGNADLISVVANLAIKMPGFNCDSLGTSHLTELSRFVYETANMSYRPAQPFVGSSAFAHKGGMHVHAVAKATESYEHIPPEAVGNVRRILVSELSGRSNIAALVTHPDVKNDKAILDSILGEVCRLENEGWQFESADASFDLLVERCAGSFSPVFKKVIYTVSVESRPDSGVRTEAMVKLTVGSAERHEVAEGDGPVNALDAAMRKALEPVYPTLRRMHLLDYKVRVINAQEGTAAKVRVSIESTDGDAVWGTVGVSENVIEASWLALADSFHYFISRKNVAVC